MAEKLVSPGVFTKENDLSFVAQGVGEIGAAIVGPFKQGPAWKPTIVTTQSELTDIFGAADSTYYTMLTAQNYLRENGVVTICRTAGVNGYTDPGAVLLRASGSTAGDKVVGILFNTADGITGSAFVDFGSGSFTLNGISASLKQSSNASIDDVFGESALGTKGAYTVAFFENHGVTIDFADYFAVSSSQDFSDEASVAQTPWIKSQLIGGDRYDLFKFYTLAEGRR